MSHYVQVLNGLVVNVWDSPPRVPIGEDGWRNAVEAFDPLVEGRQKYGKYTFDITKDPVEIKREILEVSVEERKQNMLSENERQYMNFVEVVSKAPSFYDQNDITNAKNLCIQNKTAIDAANTHSALDKVIFQKLNLF